MTLTFPMWRDGHKRLLGEVIAKVDVEVSWRMTWFDGSVLPGHPLPALDTHIDVPLTSTQLNQLADALTDLNEISLKGLFRGVEFSLVCQDSTRWMVSGSPECLDMMTTWFGGFDAVRSTAGTLPTTSTRS